MRRHILFLLFAAIPAILAAAPALPADSLYGRGEATVYRASRGELQYIGMPVGGITAGGVYLGGDGRLWLWDIFNDVKEGVEPKTVPWTEPSGKETYVRNRDGASYIEPSTDVRPLRQGFVLQIRYDGRTVFKTLGERDWDEITFRATYPVAEVRYIDRSMPLEVVLHAYSPFIPLDADDSGLPATVLSFSVVNKGQQDARVSVLGYLENKAGLRMAPEKSRRFNEVAAVDGMAAVLEGVSAVYPRDTALIASRPDYGTLCIAALGAGNKAWADADTGFPAKMTFDDSPAVTRPMQRPLTGAVQNTSGVIGPGESWKADFVISWHFANLTVSSRVPDNGRWYANRFGSALDAARYVAGNFGRLESQTMLWAETWADSSLPHWFLERTFLTINTLATANAHRFSSGRFWAWEGVGACPGTCTHVWHYAQAMGRIFPELERDCRERTDLKIAMQPDGGIIFRAEMETRPAIDGQAGCVLRCWREHQMSPDNAFLIRNWPEIRRAVQFIIDQDKNGDGMVDTPLENTLDAVWDGEIAWIVGLCIVGVKAGEEMAVEAGDREFAALCRGFVERGSKNMDELLFNGEYYIHRPDPEKGRAKLGSYNTCHIDQVLGQAWAWQVGLGRIQEREKTLSALRALWKYNYMSDVGPYIATHGGGRPYALPGEGGMVMNTNPYGEAKPYGDNVTWQLGYFHECMSGFEYQVAAHMIAEGMTGEGLTLVKAIHDRYHASKRNPFNEIECSDHYARAMAGYGAFIAACGFEYHGPKGRMSFAPRWDADDFRAPFTAAEGWGTYWQKIGAGVMTCGLEPKYGKVELAEFGVTLPEPDKVRRAEVTLDGKKVSATLSQDGDKAFLHFKHRTAVKAGSRLSIQLKIDN